MTKLLRWLLVLFILLIGLAVFAGFASFTYYGYHLPYEQAENTMPPGGSMTLVLQTDGSLHLTWPEGIRQDRYLVEVLDHPSWTEPNVLYSVYVRSNSCVLPFLPQDRQVTIRISTARAYAFPFDEEARLRPGNSSLEITGVFAQPEIENMTWTPDPDTQTVQIRFDLGQDLIGRIYYLDKDGQPVYMDELAGSGYTVTFGDEGAFPVPEYHDCVTFLLDAYMQNIHFTYYGLDYKQFSVIREDLLGTTLNLKCVDEGNNLYSFSWNETKGDGYEFQQYDFDDEQWYTIHTVEKEGDRSYTTLHLPRYTDYRFRVIAPDTNPLNEPIAVSEEISFRTGPSLVYSTVWPIHDLEIYSDPERTEVIGTAKHAKAFCVLEAEGTMFYIRSGNTYGYIDGNYCLINLPEFIGDICMYNITNSYASLYMAHEYEIPTVTNTIIIGYEDVQLYNERFLVPLLYPAALKLEKAAFAAIEEGYKIHIYDAFRPREATDTLYQMADELRDTPIPETTFSGEPVENMPELKEGEILTYGNLMTDYGRYTMNYFLAKGYSKHNMGIAMDLTLYDLRKREDVEMQTSMHDLSWYSELKANNEFSKELAEIMKAAGFNGLVSEWWHFQDDEAREALELKTYMWDGVDSQCWMADDYGWKYRRSDGRYYYNTTRTIDGVKYTFDGNGYATPITTE